MLRFRQQAQQSTYPFYTPSFSYNDYASLATFVSFLFFSFLFFFSFSFSFSFSFLSFFLFIIIIYYYYYSLNLDFRNEIRKNGLLVNSLRHSAASMATNFTNSFLISAVCFLSPLSLLPSLLLSGSYFFLFSALLNKRTTKLNKPMEWVSEFSSLFPSSFHFIFIYYIYYYLLLFIIIYYYLLLFIIIYYYLLLFIIIYYYLLLFIIIYLALSFSFFKTRPRNKKDPLAMWLHWSFFCCWSSCFPPPCCHGNLADGPGILSYPPFSPFSCFPFSPFFLPFYLFFVSFFGIEFSHVRLCF